MDKQKSTDSLEGAGEGADFLSSGMLDGGVGCRAGFSSDSGVGVGLGDLATWAANC